MSPAKTRCLILACGNTLRSDDGIGPWLPDWAEKQFESDPRVRVISRQQWTPDLAADIARKPKSLVRATRMVLTENLKRHMQDYLGLGLYAEMLALMDRPGA